MVVVAVAAMEVVAAIEVAVVVVEGVVVLAVAAMEVVATIDVADVVAIATVANQAGASAVVPTVHCSGTARQRRWCCSLTGRASSSKKTAKKMQKMQKMQKEIRGRESRREIGMRVTKR